MSLVWRRGKWRERFWRKRGGGGIRRALKRWDCWMLVLGPVMATGVCVWASWVPFQIARADEIDRGVYLAVGSLWLWLVGGFLCGWLWVCATRLKRWSEALLVLAIVPLVLSAVGLLLHVVLAMPAFPMRVTRGTALLTPRSAPFTPQLEVRIDSEFATWDSVHTATARVTVLPSEGEGEGERSRRDAGQGAVQSVRADRDVEKERGVAVLNADQKAGLERFLESGRLKRGVSGEDAHPFEVVWKEHRTYLSPGKRWRPRIWPFAGLVGVFGGFMLTLGAKMAQRAWRS